MVTPMLSVVYWGDQVNKSASSLVHNYEVALGIVTLGGALVGQLIFGIAADIWGRRKMYGLELIILIFSTLGMSMSSSGKNDSMSMIGVLLFWRFFMGLGVGADYPLSAVICSECASLHPHAYGFQRSSWLMLPSEIDLHQPGSEAGC